VPIRLHEHCSLKEHGLEWAEKDRFFFFFLICSVYIYFYWS